MSKRNNTGVILFVVIGVILVVGVLANVLLRIISNQSRLTHHQVSRIQAQYAAKAGVVYALDKLRRNDDASWPAVGTITKRMCRQIIGPNCLSADIIEDALPSSIQYVDIYVDNPGSGVSNTRKVSATANYLYTP